MIPTNENSPEKKKVMEIFPENSILKFDCYRTCQTIQCTVQDYVQYEHIIKQNQNVLIPSENSN